METVHVPGSYWARELFTIPGKGYCAVVSNPSECSDFAHLKGFAYINGVACIIEAVEAMGVPPYKQGQNITLLYRRRQC